MKIHSINSSLKHLLGVLRAVPNTIKDTGEMKVKVGSLLQLSLWCVLVCLFACLTVQHVDLSFWTRDQTCASKTRSTVLTPEPLRKSLFFYRMICVIIKISAMILFWMGIQDFQLDNPQSPFI